MSSLDNCAVCGNPVPDFDLDGYEAADGQRGHHTCHGDAPNLWDPALGHGLVCSRCGALSPCPGHQPAAHDRILLELTRAWGDIAAAPAPHPPVRSEL